MWQRCPRCNPTSVAFLRLAVPAPQSALSQRAKHVGSQWQSAILTASLKTTEARPFSSSAPCGAYSAVRFGTIVTQTPETTTASELISHIRPSPIRRFKAGTKFLAVFLVTPTLSRWLADDTFLQEAMNRVSPKGQHFLKDTEVQALVAVVDRLSTPRHANTNVQRTTDGRTNSPPVNDNGVEGLSYAFMDASQLLATSEADDGYSRDDIAATNIHTFSVSFDTAGENAQSDGKDSTRSYEVKVPLANTIFHTGRAATLFTSTWIREREAFSCRKKTFHKHVSLQWPSTSPLYRGGYYASAPSASAPSQDSTAFNTPLIPLTVPRRIYSGMGNIIRQTVDNDDKPQLASLELERALIEYFKYFDRPQASIPVWALVFSPKVAEYMLPLSRNLGLTGQPGDLASSKVLKSAKFYDHYDFVLKNGGKIHRVQSGGGGWGKKAGLLSLDPTTYFERSSQSSESDHLLKGMMSMSEELGIELKEVAKPGDYIQFLVSPINLEDYTKVEASHFETGTNVESFEFGTIPSTIDVVPQKRSEADYKSDNIGTFNEHFGALSEAGIGLRGKTKNGGDVTNVEPDFMHTTVDVPYSRFSLYESRIRKKNLKLAKFSNASTTEQALKPHAISVHETHERNNISLIPSYQIVPDMSGRQEDVNSDFKINRNAAVNTAKGMHEGTERPGPEATDRAYLRNARVARRQQMLKAISLPRDNTGFDGNGQVSSKRFVRSYFSNNPRDRQKDLVFEKPTPSQYPSIATPQKKNRKTLQPLVQLNDSRRPHIVYHVDETNRNNYPPGINTANLSGEDSPKESQSETRSSDTEPYDYQGRMIRALNIRKRADTEPFVWRRRRARGLPLRVPRYSSLLTPKSNPHLIRCVLPEDKRFRKTFGRLRVRKIKIGLAAEIAAEHKARNDRVDPEEFSEADLAWTAMQDRIKKHDEECRKRAHDSAGSYGLEEADGVDTSLKSTDKDHEQWETTAMAWSPKRLEKSAAGIDKLMKGF